MSVQTAMSSARIIGKSVMEIVASTGPKGESSRRSKVPATSSLCSVSARPRPEWSTEMITRPDRDEREVLVRAPDAVDRHEPRHEVEQREREDHRERLCSERRAEAHVHAEVALEDRPERGEQLPHTDSTSLPWSSHSRRSKDAMVAVCAR